MNIYESISKIMEEIPAIGKTKKNGQQGFMFRGIDDVMNVLQPLLSKHKVFIVPEVLEQTREERVTKTGGNLIYSICKIKYKFYAEDSTNIEAITIGEGMDSGDKATNKAMAIAMKYALFQVFCIPTEDIKNPDAETPPESTPTVTIKSVSNEDGEKIIDGTKVVALQQAFKNAKYTKLKMDSLLNYFGYIKIEEIKIKDYKAIQSRIEQPKSINEI